MEKERGEEPQEYIELEDIFLPDFEDKIEDKTGTKSKSERKTPTRSRR
jgi:hypothetical protein